MRAEWSIASIVALVALVACASMLTLSTHAPESRVSEGSTFAEPTLIGRITGELEDANLAATGVRITPSTVRSGSTAQLRFMVINLGGRSATLNYEITDGADTSTEVKLDTPIPMCVIGMTLEPSEACWVAREVTYTALGAQTVTLTLDPDNEVQESDEDDNERTDAVSVRPTPEQRQALRDNQLIDLGTNANPGSNSGSNGNSGGATDPPPPASCTSNADCNDYNSCTTDVCTTGTCTRQAIAPLCPQPSAAACGQTQLPTNGCGTCTVKGSFCPQGTCTTSGTTMSCVQGCTQATSSLCADTNPCTTNERCSTAGSCVADTITASYATPADIACGAVVPSTNGCMVPASDLVGTKCTTGTCNTITKQCVTQLTSCTTNAECAATHTCVMPPGTCTAKGLFITFPDTSADTLQYQLVLPAIGTGYRLEIKEGINAYRLLTTASTANQIVENTLDMDGVAVGTNKLRLSIAGSTDVYEVTFTKTLRAGGTPGQLTITTPNGPITIAAGATIPIAATYTPRSTEAFDKINVYFVGRGINALVTQASNTYIDTVWNPNTYCLAPGTYKLVFSVTTARNGLLAYREIPVTITATDWQLEWTRAPPAAIGPQSEAQPTMPGIWFSAKATRGGTAVPVAFRVKPKGSSDLDFVALGAVRVGSQNGERVGEWQFGAGTGYIAPNPANGEYTIEAFTYCRQDDNDYITKRVQTDVTVAGRSLPSTSYQIDGVGPNIMISDVSTNAPSTNPAGWTTGTLTVTAKDSVGTGAPWNAVGTGTASALTDIIVRVNGVPIGGYDAVERFSVQNGVARTITFTPTSFGAYSVNPYPLTVAAFANEQATTGPFVGQGWFSSFFAGRTIGDVGITVPPPVSVPGSVEVQPTPTGPTGFTVTSPAAFNVLSGNIIPVDVTFAPRPGTSFERLDVSIIGGGMYELIGQTTERTFKQTATIGATCLLPGKYYLVIAARGPGGSVLDTKEIPVLVTQNIYRATWKTAPTLRTNLPIGMYGSPTGTGYSFDADGFIGGSEVTPMIRVKPEGADDLDYVTVNFDQGRGEWAFTDEATSAGLPNPKSGRYVLQAAVSCTVNGQEVVQATIEETVTVTNKDKTTYLVDRHGPNLKIISMITDAPTNDPASWDTITLTVEGRDPGTGGAWQAEGAGATNSLSNFIVIVNSAPVGGYGSVRRFTFGTDGKGTATIRRTDLPQLSLYYPLTVSAFANENTAGGEFSSGLQSKTVGRE